MNERELEIELEIIAPGFADYSKNQPMNYGNDGSIRTIVSHFESFINNHSDKVQWDKLGDLLNGAVVNRNDDVELALCSCLIEKIARKQHPLLPFLNGYSLKYWNYWI